MVTLDDERQWLLKKAQSDLEDALYEEEQLQKQHDSMTAREHNSSYGQDIMNRLHNAKLYTQSRIEALKRAEALCKSCGQTKDVFKEQDRGLER